MATGDLKMMLDLEERKVKLEGLGDMPLSQYAALEQAKVSVISQHLEGRFFREAAEAMADSLIRDGKLMPSEREEFLSMYLEASANEQDTDFVKRFFLNRERQHAHEEKLREQLYRESAFMEALKEATEDE